MKALVIGASGLVGGALLRALEQAGIEAVGTYQSHPLPQGCRLDVRDRQALHGCVEAIRPTVVLWAVNTPGGVDRCEAHPAEATALHLEGVRHLADSAIRHGTKVVYYSTDYLFDGRQGPYTELDEPCPINVYGQAKWQAERLITAQVPDHLILRTTAVFGWDQRSKNFAMQVWERLQAGRPLRAPDDEWCSPTLADYLAEVTVRLVQSGAHGVWHVAGKDRLPRAELGRLLARALALDPDLILSVPTAELGPRAPRPLQGGLTTEKLRSFLGTEPLDLQESLKRFRRHWRADTHLTPEPPAVSTEAEQLKRRILDDVRRYYTLVHQPRPFVPQASRVHYAGRVFGDQELVNAVDSALDFWLTLGPYGQEFERKMRRWLGVRDVVLVNSGSVANLTAVLTLMSRQVERPLQPGDEVITPAATFPTTLAPLVHSGLVPVFVDAEVGTYNINPELLERAVSAKTRALMIPHTLGNPCDMEVICKVAERHGLYLIEDACDALGSTFQDRRVGTFGDLATLSFFPAHHITMGEGGAVVVNHPSLARIVRSVRDWGRDCWCAPGESNTCGKRFGWQLGALPKGYDHKFIYSNIGYNFKPTDLQAAIGVAQADRLDGFIAARRRNFSKLYQALETFQDALVLPRRDPRSNPAWFGFPITVKDPLPRQELVQWLEHAKIETRELFGGNILKQPAYQHITARIAGSLEQTDRIMRDTFFIGVYPGLTDEAIDFVGLTFAEFFASRRTLVHT